MLAAAPAQAATFTVNSLFDEGDSNPGDGICQAVEFPCTLRAAIEEANALSASEPDTVNVPAGTYQLFVNSGGAIEITDGELNIVGAGARSTVIRQETDGNGDGLDRVFDMNGAFFEVIVSISGVTIADGRATSANGFFGGNIRSTGIVTISRSVITGGRAFSGGGISNLGPGSMTIVDSTISGNSAPDGGADSGAIQNWESDQDNPASLTIRNSTISGNSAGNSGGIHSWSSSTSPGGSTVDVINSTIAGNTSTGSNAGGLHTADGAVANVRNSIVAGNSSPGPGPNCSSASGGSNLSGGFNVESGTDCGFAAAGDKPSTNPLLSALANNGGPTDTHAIAASSPAKNAASATFCPPADQRGVARPQGTACDMGAFELEESPPPGSPPAPAVSSANAGKVGAGTVQLTGIVDTQGLQTTWYFEYGPTTAYGSQTPFATLGGATTPQTVTADVAGLQSNTTYHYRLRASNSAGETVGENRTFATAKKTLADLPPPELGETTNVEPVSGNVLVALPPGASAAARGRGSQKGLDFVPLEEARQIPVGSFLDTGAGRVRLQSASATAGKTQTGEFFDGLFQVLQSRSGPQRGLTELRLKGSSFRSCRPSGGGGKRAAAARKRLSKKTIRTLGGSAGGKFRSRGRHSSATVRGTIWTTVDRCDGTLTKVRRGRVAVRDFRRKRTILVRAGKSYLARAQG